MLIWSGWFVKFSDMNETSDSAVNGGALAFWISTTIAVRLVWAGRDWRGLSRIKSIIVVDFLFVIFPSYLCQQTEVVSAIEQFRFIAKIQLE